MLAVEPKIPLYYPCGEKDVCEDDNAQCTGGQCLCTARFYDVNNKCGMHCCMNSCHIQ